MEEVHIRVNYTCYITGTCQFFLIFLNLQDSNTQPDRFDTIKIVQMYEQIWFGQEQIVLQNSSESGQ